MKMDRRHLLGGAGLALATAVSTQLRADPHKQKHHHAQHDHFRKCADACAACATECGSCHEHCATLAVNGSKDHIATMRLCNDCQIVCSSSATLCAKRGPLSVAQCRACVEACEACADACEKFPNDEHMALCAKRCRECAAACKRMIEAEA